MMIFVCCHPNCLLYVIGYSFNPWVNPRTIADGPVILQYINDTATKFNISNHIQYRRKVVQVHWSSDTNIYTLNVSDTKSEEILQYKCSFIFFCTGYYSYDKPYQPTFNNMSEYQGKVIHAQFFDNTIDYQDKKVIVVGSGATAVTLVPALAESGASNVTMIQRSPTYIVSLPSTDSLNLKLRTSKYIPTWLANFIIFWRASLLSVYIYWYARRNPLQMKKYIIDGVRKHLTVNGKEIVDVDKHFTPTYMPWDQRLCLTPDQQFFNAIRNGKVQIYTDKISKFTKNGIMLENESNEIEADIIVLATGLNLEVMNNIPIFVDNELINVSETLLYKDMMLTKIPNMTFCMGYINSSWTLKVDMSCRYMCRIINYMSQKNYKKIVVTPNDPLMPQYPMIPNVSSGYILRSISKFPKTGDSFPWIRLSNYVKDLFMFTFSSVTEKEFRYS